MTLDRTVTADLQTEQRFLNKIQIIAKVKERAA